MQLKHQQGRSYETTTRQLFETPRIKTNKHDTYHLENTEPTGQPVFETLYQYIEMYTVKLNVSQP